MIIILQQLIVASEALPELKRLLLMREQSEVQCHTAGTFRNLAAEDQSQVRVCIPDNRLFYARHLPRIQSVVGLNVSAALLKTELSWV